jgi:tRNA 5-methylaminomethyl-2-thiouridine biosynthesis bifunctional protein
MSNESAAMQELNFQMLRHISPVFHQFLEANQKNGKSNISSRPGRRCSTPDYLPLAGPVEKNRLTASIYSGYQRNARQEIRATPDYYPGLYINIAHGSSGLVTTPLLGEYIASLISREPLPLNQDEIGAVLPVRYLIRNLKRQKP